MFVWILSFAVTASARESELVWSLEQDGVELGSWAKVEGLEVSWDVVVSLTDGETSLEMNAWLEAAQAGMMVLHGADARGEPVRYLLHGVEIVGTPRDGIELAIERIERG